MFFSFNFVLFTREPEQPKLRVGAEAAKRRDGSVYSILNALSAFPQHNTVLIKYSGNNLLY